MENTIENKLKFYGLFIGQEVYFFESKIERITPYLLHKDYGMGFLMEAHLELTPLSKITDEHAIEIAKIVTYNPDDINYNPDNVWVGNGDENGKGKYYIEIGVGSCWEAELTITENGGVKLIYEDNNIDIYDSVRIFDFLRSKGYALPYNGLSVEQLIEYGWIKLKIDNE